ncbi:zinc finger CCHC domain-containing protein 7 isoform X2 [Labrus mixtus]|uniref:zinc finger CCHC domain-containing protein 7 isoform X2 n=1 Tax=Labrus mixtus TaxID=508554 RepID=UPI0029C00072|nr:zinc finger CCHC domain-containing protein 7 isoform X2 [Labrus mixtus]
MYCAYQDREELEDNLYQEDGADSEGSEVNSELEFHLYSQLHYSSNAGVTEEKGEEGEGQESQQPEPEVMEKTADGGKEQTGEERPQSPDLSKIEQYLKKKKKKKGEKEKKGKSNPKGLKSKTRFEQVIVIDSGPDVISISDGETTDEDDDEEGVCSSKGQGLGRPQTSTPAAQGTKGSKKRVSALVTVDSSSSDSDSEKSESKSESESSESSDSSDSDGLENWMILGRGNQDGDHSISLNLEGGFNSNADVEDDRSWTVSDKDKEAQIYNKDKGAKVAVQRLLNRYYTSKNVQCRNCNKNGHLSKNCPQPKKVLPCFLCGTPGHLSSECPNRHCNNCGLPGHIYNSCNERAYWHKQCHRCHMTGHFFDACPEIWRQYHITTKPGVPGKQRGEDHGRSPASCYNCSRKGHFGHACTQRRMFNGTFPSTPFINYYDTMQDINRRGHRTKMKMKDLKKSGLYPAASEAPVTPGPPKKKQKLSHVKNNQKPNHTPRQNADNHKPNRTPRPNTDKHKHKHKPNQTPGQTTGNHKPDRSHIFFQDDDFEPPAAKKNKRNKHKQPESAGNVKPWKPKRPVPTSRERPAKLTLDEADDFPRGGATKKQRKKKETHAPSGPPGGHGDGRADRLSWTVRGEVQGSRQQKGEKKKRKRKQEGKGDSNKNHDAHMYPTDENLFIIKQKKRKSR